VEWPARQSTIFLTAVRPSTRKITKRTRNRVVDVYVVPDVAAGDDQAPPELVLGSVTVAEDVRGEGGFGASGEKAAVTLLVESDDVPSVIDAVAHGSVYLVHVPAGSSS
jgi:hypothetical protein